MKLNEARKNLLSRGGLLTGAGASVASLATGISLVLGGGTGSPYPSARSAPAPIEATTTSTTPVALNEPVVGMASTPDGRGYWLVASDGGIFNFGAAHFRGSEGAASPARVVGMARGGRMDGYWMSGRDGSVFALGAPSFGSIGGGYSSAALGAAIVRLASSQIGQTNAGLYGGSGGEWCAAFASWVYRNAGLPIGALTAAYQIGTWAQSGGGTLLPPSATPQPGDAVLFEPNGTGLAWPGPGLDISHIAHIAHVNIVASVNPDGSFTTIGGNESAGGASAVRQQGTYSVASAPSWWGQTVYGFARPG